MCKMCARVVVAYAVFAALGVACARAQDTQIYVEVSPNSDNLDSETQDIEKRSIPQLARELEGAKADALLLYTEYTAKAGNDLKSFMGNISGFTDEALKGAENRPAHDDRGNCRSRFEKDMKKIELDAYRAASFSGENHHKFLLGHMVVFRMHINKTDEYLKKCDKALYGCGLPCENNPKVKRWKRLANEEINRVKDDLQHTRLSYKDLVAHARRRLNHLRKQITARTTETVGDYQKCLSGVYKYDSMNL